MADGNHGPDHVKWADPPKDYAISGKIMLSAIVVLFTVVIFMVILHVYARWYIHRVRRNNLRRQRRQRASHIVFYVDNTATAVTAPSSGLDPAVVSSLPVFEYSTRTHACVLECAVCLSEFEDGEKGKLLPKCQHCFHTDCIDMWFESHSTCPLCRSPVDPVMDSSSPVDPVRDSNTGRGPGSDMRKNSDLVIQVPERNGNRVSDDECSPAARTPGTRMLSLKRILSMNRKSSVPPGVGPSRNDSITESDLELGLDELTHVETRVQSPK